MRYIDVQALYAKAGNWSKTGNTWKCPVLKKDFRDTFHCKCWYTEVSCAGHDIDIDHFRPKNDVKPYGTYNYNPVVGGYHWLANDYKNFRASCRLANRITGTGTLQGGKSSYFPLLHGSPHMTAVNGAIEQPMLLDPLKKSDVNLLTFTRNQVDCSKPHDATACERVRVSKAIYSLSNGDIASERIKVWDAVQEDIDAYSAGNITISYLIIKLERAISKDSPHSACAIACVRSNVFDTTILSQLNLQL